MGPTRSFFLAAGLATFFWTCGGGGGGGGPQAALAEDEPAVAAATPGSIAVVVTPPTPKNVPTFAAAPNVVTFGVPLAKEWGIGQVAGRPALGITGANTWQFRTLDTWANGSVKWALAEVALTVGNGASPSVGLTFGSGKSAQADLVTSVGNLLVINTGPMQVNVRKSGFNLFDKVVVDGVQLVLSGQSEGIAATLPDGSRLTSSIDTQVSIAENGPARAMIRADGTLKTVGGLAVVDFSCRISAVAGSRDLKVDFTVRNANIERPQHAVLGGIELALQMRAGSSMQARFAQPVGEMSLPMLSTDRAWSYQAYSTAPTDGVDGPGPGYKPHIPKLNATTLAEEGYSIFKNGVAQLQTDKTAYPDPGWADLTGSIGGVSVAIQRMPYFWPAALEIEGSGRVAVGIFSDVNAADYTFCWRQHESRSAIFSFHAGPTAVDPRQAALRLDNPVIGRMQKYLFYRDADAFPYELVNIKEHNTAYHAMGIPHNVSVVPETVMVQRFLSAGQGGGANNHDSIERRLCDEFLRHGHGGQLQRALDLALYKSEWQILRSDNFLHEQDPGASNDALPHSESYDADAEHRYRDGIGWAYFLTGDERFREALVDEAEILPTIKPLAFERAAYQTIKADVALARFFKHTDPAAVAKIEAALRAQLQYLTPPIQDIYTENSGFGWETTPGFGQRGYYVNSQQNMDETPPGENYVTRGWISAHLGPIAFFVAAGYLGLGDAEGFNAAARLRDLATYTQFELYPYNPVPADRMIAYSYAVTLQQVTEWDTGDFHTILLGMAAAFQLTGDSSYLQKGVEQLKALEARGHLYESDRRLDNQHFMRVYLDSKGL